jgi:spastin
MNTGRPSALEPFKQQYENAWQLLNAGLKADEQNKPQQAKDYYKDALLIIDDALTFKFTPQEYHTASPMRAKLMEHKNSFSRRVSEIEDMQQRPNTRSQTQRQTQPPVQPTQYVQPPPQQEQESGMLGKMVNFFWGAPSTYPKASPPQGNRVENPIYVYDDPPKRPVSQPVPQYIPAPTPHQRPLSQPPKQKQTGAAKPVNQDWTKSPELKGIDKKILDHILNEVVEHKPSVSWDDIAGLQDAKQTLYETVILPSLRPDLFNGLRAPSKGVLLFGPPGNGKTMLARAVASQSKSTFFSISASSIVSKYHGESEKLVQALFAAARYLSPSVVFIDEIDSILSARSSDEHEASRRMKTEFLVQMDGVVSNSGEQPYRVLLMGATNRPFELDDAILRRFPKRVHIPLPDAVARKALIQNLIKGQHVRLSKGEMDRVAQLTEGFSGSDLANLCQETALLPLREMPPNQVLTIRAEDVRPMDFEDFQASTRRIRPSTSRELLVKLEQWNQQYGTFSK